MTTAAQKMKDQKVKDRQRLMLDAVAPVDKVADRLMHDPQIAHQKLLLKVEYDHEQGLVTYKCDMADGRRAAVTVSAVEIVRLLTVDTLFERVKSGLLDPTHGKRRELEIEYLKLAREIIPNRIAEDASMSEETREKWLRLDGEWITAKMLRAVLDALFGEPWEDAIGKSGGPAYKRVSYEELQYIVNRLRIVANAPDDEYIHKIQRLLDDSYEIRSNPDE